MKLHTSMIALAVVFADLGWEAWQLAEGFQSKMLRSVPVGLAFHGNPTHILLGALVVILGLTILSLLLREMR